MGLVTIKSYHSGLSLILDDKADFADILVELGEKFEDSRKFFRDAKVALSIDGRLLSEEEEISLVHCINEHSDIRIFCIIGKDEETEKRFIKALKRVDMQNNLNDTRLFLGDVYEDDVCEAEGNLIVLGDVHKGGVLSATKNIIVLGSMKGMAMCATSRECGMGFAAAYDMQPERLNIGGMVYKDNSKPNAFKKNKAKCLLIKAKDGRLLTEEFNREGIRELVKGYAENL